MFNICSNSSIGSFDTSWIPAGIHILSFSGYAVFNFNIATSQVCWSAYMIGSAVNNVNNIQVFTILLHPHMVELDRHVLAVVSIALSIVDHLSAVTSLITHFNIR